MHKQFRHLLLFIFWGPAIACLLYLLFAKNIMPGSIESVLMDGSFFFFPLVLIIIMITTYKAETFLTYRQKFVLAACIIFPILLTVILLNLFNVSGRTINTADIIIGLVRLSIFAVLQLGIAAVIVLIPSRVIRN